jgi:hypothetical protein
MLGFIHDAEETIWTKTEEETGDWRKFNNKELHNLYVPPDIIIISCHRFSFFPGTSPLEPVVNPTTQASSLSL